MFGSLHPEAFNNLFAELLESNFSCIHQIVQSALHLGVTCLVSLTALKHTSS